MEMTQGYSVMWAPVLPPGGWDAEADWATLPPSPKICCPSSALRRDGVRQDEQPSRDRDQDRLASVPPRCRPEAAERVAKAPPNAPPKPPRRPRPSLTGRPAPTLKGPVPMRILQDRHGRPVPLRPAQALRASTALLPDIEEERRRRRRQAGDLPAPAPPPSRTPEAGVRASGGRTCDPTLERQVAEGFTKAMKFIQAELAAPRTFGDKVRGAVHKLGSGLGGLLRRCLGGRVR
ncbi:hypothetical protein [Roseateles chitinivorans]|uniref:hypothetical protein n=1 Tax=Roseateles chitinivorans TaxID=2917965 RepID=UPI003D6786F4